MYEYILEQKCIHICHIKQLQLRDGGGAWDIIGCLKILLTNYITNHIKCTKVWQAVGLMNNNHIGCVLFFFFFSFFASIKMWILIGEF